MPIHKTKKRFSLERFGFSPATETIVLAALVGILGAFGALFFKRLILLVQFFFWHTHDMMPGTLLGIPWWIRLLVPAIGGLIVGPLVYFFAREAKGHGVPEVIAAVVTRNGVIRPAVVLVKTLASAVSIGSGGSVGREGPIVQIGAAIASTFGQLLRLRPVQMKTLVACGVAAGIGSTFNAPIAGTIFALELIAGDFGLTSFTPIIVSSVTATAITRHFQGNTYEFILPAFHMVSFWELFIYLFLGLIAGVVGYSFSRSLYFVDDGFQRLGLPEWSKPALGGLGIGVIALSYPHIMGVGYDTIEVLFRGELTLGVMVLLVFLKILGTSITIGSGGSGGIFAPSLFIGAMLGGAFGTVVNMIFPESTGAVGAYALVGMAAVNSASTLAPLSAMIILIELTNNYGMILPLMFTVVIASFVSRKFSSESIYTRKLARKGIHVHLGEDLNILRAIGVKDIIRREASVIHDSASVKELMNLALTEHRNVIFVIDAEEKYQGVISLQSLKHTLSKPEKFIESKKLEDFVEYLPFLTEKQTLDIGLTLFGETGFDTLPVVDDTGKLTGFVFLTDVIRQYNREVVNRNIAIELGAKINSTDKTKQLNLGSDALVTEITVPHWLEGRVLGDIGLRKNFGVSVFLVKQGADTKEPTLITPGSSYVFRSGDTLLVSGAAGAIEKIRTGG